MASYYYLISSLPDLRTDGDMPMTYDEFLDMCQSNVSESKYELLKNLTLSSEEGPLLKEWSAFYKNLMGELNYQRSVSLGRPYLTSYDKDSVIAQVAGAVQWLRRIRWRQRRSCWSANLIILIHW